MAPRVCRLQTSRIEDHRKLIATAFKQDQLQSYLSAFARNSIDLSPDPSGRSVEIYEFAQTH